LTTSSRVTASEVSIVAELPLRSVMRNWPRLTPAPPLSCDRAVSLEASPPPCSSVIVPAPTRALEESANPSLMLCWVVTVRETWN